MHRFHRRLYPAAVSNGVDHGWRNHVIGEVDGVAEFDVLVGTKLFPLSEMETHWDQLWEWKAVGLGERSSGKHRSNGAGFESEHEGLAVAGSFWKQNATKAVGDAI